MSEKTFDRISNWACFLLGFALLYWAANLYSEGFSMRDVAFFLGVPLVSLSGYISGRSQGSW